MVHVVFSDERHDALVLLEDIVLVDVGSALLQELRRLLLDGALPSDLASVVMLDCLVPLLYKVMSCELAICRGRIVGSAISRVRGLKLRIRGSADEVCDLIEHACARC